MAAILELRDADCVLAQPRTATTSVAPLLVADLAIDALFPVVPQGRRTIRLTPGEHRLLYLMAAHPGTVVTAQIYAAQLGHAAPESNSLARHIASLRKKLGDTAERPRCMQTVKGVGYRFVSGEART